MFRLLVKAALCASAASCATANRSISTELFRDPTPHLGQSVIACGYMVDLWNLTERRSGSRGGVGRGLSVRHGGSALERQLLSPNEPICLAGRIFWAGCETDPERVCVDLAFDYGIEVDRLVDAPAGDRE